MHCANWSAASAFEPDPLGVPDEPQAVSATAQASALSAVRT
jgi:hypothetical protein